MSSEMKHQESYEAARLTCFLHIKQANWNELCISSQLQLKATTEVFVFENNYQAKKCKCQLYQLTNNLK